MKKISQILLDSVGTRKQSFQSLAEVSGNQRSNYKISRYCAIGAVGCENKFIKLVLRNSHYDGQANYHIQGLDQERKILRNAGIPLKIITQDFRKYMSQNAMKAIAKGDDWVLRNPVSLETLIMTLNDSCKWNFLKISHEMSYLEERGKILYEEDKLNG